MKNRSGFITGLFLLSGILSANARTKEFPLPSSIYQVANYTSIPVEYRYGSPKMVIEGKDNLVEKVDALVNGRELRIDYTRDAGNFSAKDLHITVWGEDIGKFANYGSGDFNADRIDVLGLWLSNYGSGDILVRNIDVSKLQVDLYGSGDIVVDNCDSVVTIVVCNGSGDAVINNMDTTTFEVLLQGSGDIKINNLDSTSVKATNNGTGNIRMKGDTTSAVLINNGSGFIDTKSLTNLRLTIINN